MDSCRIYRPHVARSYFCRLLRCGARGTVRCCWPGGTSVNNVVCTSGRRGKVEFLWIYLKVKRSNHYQTVNQKYSEELSNVIVKYDASKVFGWDRIDSFISNYQGFTLIEYKEASFVLISDRNHDITLPKFYKHKYLNLSRIFELKVFIFSLETLFCDQI